MEAHDATTTRLARLRCFAQAMEPESSPVDQALPRLRALLRAAGVAFKIVGGVAVVHHGYQRTTVDLDVLIEADDLARLDAELLAVFGFVRTSAARLTHQATGVRVDLLISGQTLPRPGSQPFPSPASVEASLRDPEVIGLAGLLALKLQAARHRDTSDVVELLKRLDPADYQQLEARMDPGQRSELYRLWQDALEEKSWEG